MSEKTATPSPLHRQEAPPPSLADRVPMREKLAYGIGSLGGGLQSGADDRLLVPIFVNTLHVSPAIMSTLAVIYRIWDGITDMIMGWLSDNTRTRWGRRRPYLLIGSVLSGLALPTFWLFNPAWELKSLIIWMCCGQLVLYLVNTIWNIPYQSLLFELSPSSVERTNVTAVRSYFSKLAGLGLAWMWWLAQRPIFQGADGKPDVIVGAAWVCAAIGVVSISCGVCTAVFTRERFYHTAKKTAAVPFWANLRMTLSNQPFQLLAVITLFFVLGNHINNALMFYVRLYHVSGGDTQLAAKIAGLGGTIEVFASIAGIPAVQWLARRFGKRATLVGVMVLVSLTGMSTWFTYTPDFPYLCLLSYLLSAPALSAVWILIPSMTSDVVDHEELKSGTRREGAFAASFSWLFKLSGSLATALSGFVVVWAGFQVKLGAAQSEGVLFNIRLFLVFGALVFIGTAGLLCAFFPLTTRRMEEIRTELETRRGLL